MLAGGIEKPIIVFVAVIYFSGGVSFLKIFAGLFSIFFMSLRGSYPTDYIGLWRWYSIFFYDASFRTRNSSLIIEGVKRIALLN